MLALKVDGDVLYRSRDRCVQFVPVQRPMCSVCTGPETSDRWQRKENSVLTLKVYGDVFSLYRSRDRCVQFVPVQKPATGGDRFMAMCCTGPETSDRW